MAIKLFISQPMRGKTDDEIIAKRNDAISSVMDSFPGEEIEVIDSFFKGAPNDAHPLWFLGESIKLLGKADVAYFCFGWQDARGCNIEHTCAVEYGIGTMEEI